jgi:hypothetical protein
MEDPLDVEIDDPELGQEIQLLSDLMVLAARSDDLDDASIDAVLLDPAVPHQRHNGMGGALRG